MVNLLSSVCATIALLKVSTDISVYFSDGFFTSQVGVTDPGMYFEAVEEAFQAPVVKF